MSVVQQGHLGGYVEGGDPATYYEHLWRRLVLDIGITSVLDVGCGEGHAVEFFDRMGVLAEGVDGVPQPRNDIHCHDFTRGPWRNATRPLAYSMVWCCEFLEHVEERYLPNVMQTLKRADLVLLTYASPGQPGYHHVNCRPEDYWIGAMAAHGFVLDERLTTITRCWAGDNENAWNHYARRGLAFAHPNVVFTDEWWLNRAS